ncbi:NADP-dependent oxidoreductase domain-containing protein [Helicostylum pulchrum]|nr:NADP-dependent oxidoreductase domain-containing protein [Helicostylum pulchrum]
MALNRKLVRFLNVVFSLALNTGAQVDIVGLGTWLSQPDEVRKAVKYALQNGYRHLDCAYVYCNEDEVGQGIKESGLWNTHHRKEYVKSAVKASLKALGVDYLDLYLVHWPVAFTTPTVPTLDYLIPKKDGKLQIDTVDPLETWSAMEELVQEGYVKAIGLSNNNIEKISNILKHCKIKPSMLQVELHPALLQTELVEFCHKHEIGNNVYGEERVVDDPVIVSIAKKLGKSPAQRIVVIPKSVTPSRIKENFQDFILDQQDFDAIVAALGTRNTRYNDPGTKDWNVKIF